MNPEKDIIRRFVFDHLDARGCIVSLNDTIVEIQQTHHYPSALAKTINQFVLAAVLLHDSLKIKCNVTLQLRTTDQQGINPIRLVMADCMSDRRVRAIAEYNNELMPAGQSIDLTEFSSQSTLTITISPEKGERYQSIVPLEFASLSACLEDYFVRSEQLPTWFKFFALDQQAVGIALHALPLEKSKDKLNAEEDFERLRILLSTLGKEEVFDLGAQAILTRLFHEESCRLFDSRSIEYGCICSAEKSLQAIKSLGHAEASKLISEQQDQGKDSIEVDCHFCFQRYEIELSDVKELFD